MSADDRTSELVSERDVTIETYVAGAGPALVILPSYGRDGGADFDDITAQVTGAGWKVLRPQPRGVGRSGGPMTDMTMSDLANDIARVVKALAGGQAVVLGHAFGNQVARVMAVEHGHCIKAVVLAAASGSKVDPAVNETPFIAGDPSRPDTERLAALRKAFFAPGHDPTPWLAGWHPATLAMQRAAAKATDLKRYWTVGDAPVLEINAEFDPFKPEPYWEELRSQLGDRVTTIKIDGAAHALFPEQPAAVSDALLSFLPTWA